MNVDEALVGADAPWATAEARVLAAAVKRVRALWAEALKKPIGEKWALVTIAEMNAALDGAPYEDVVGAVKRVRALAARRVADDDGRGPAAISVSELLQALDGVP